MSYTSTSHSYSGYQNHNVKYDDYGTPGRKEASRSVFKMKLNVPTKKERAMFVQKNKLNLIYYTMGAAMLMFVYHMFSDGDFSFLMTLGALIQTFGVAILVMKLFRQRSFAGTSLQTLQLYALVHACRLSTNLFYEGYLPVDKTGDWIINAAEISSLLLVLAGMGIVKYSARDVSYNSVDDAFANFGPVPGQLYLIVPCLITAIAFHPTHNDSVLSDTAWMFANLLEAFAIVPQLYMLQRLKKPVEESVSHFCFSAGFSRVFLLIFWYETFREIGDGMSGYLILAIQLIHLAIMAEYCVYYLLAAKNKKPLMLPVSALV
mmetsp:Transcript_16094/g.19546  ORF Transcript_16094/g.19546 Transcript_16094/m.19546 type:complete len:319 (+) Transcript_16094:170-1126(+)